MDDLRKIREHLENDDAGQLAEMLGSSTQDIEEYLQSYENMLSEGMVPEPLQQIPLNQVDREGGITVRPTPAFVVKTRDKQTGQKVFLNITFNENVEAPHTKSLVELEGEEGVRVPLSVGPPIEDFDKKQEPCIVYDLVANPETVEECRKTPQFRDMVVQLCIMAVAQKYAVDLDTKCRLPKMKYKGSTVLLQRLKKKQESGIQEVSSKNWADSVAVHDEERKKSSGRCPLFNVFYAKSSEERFNSFMADWDLPPDSAVEAAKIDNLCGFDLPCYRVNEFKERVRGSMRNAAEKQALENEVGEVGYNAKKDTAEFLANRTCFVQVKLPDLDEHIAALKQFAVDVSDECLRLSFPLLPRLGHAAYSPLSIWWPQPFDSAKAQAYWDSEEDMLTVCLPAEMPEVSCDFDQQLLDVIF